MAEEGWPTMACVRGRVNSGREVCPEQWPLAGIRGDRAHPTSRESAGQDVLRFGAGATVAP
jgi:hypothetical protein